MDRASIEAWSTGITCIAQLIRRLDGVGFGREVERLMRLYDPAVVAAQLNLLGSHDAPRALAVLGGDSAALRLAFVLQLTLPGAPCIYYGDEIGMAGHLDPDCRRAYPAEPGAGDQALRTYVATLAAARHEHVALRRGSVRVVGASGQAVVLLREAEGHRAIVAVNAGPAPLEVALDGSGGRGGLGGPGGSASGDGLAPITRPRDPGRGADGCGSGGAADQGEVAGPGIRHLGRSLTHGGRGSV